MMGSVSFDSMLSWCTEGGFEIAESHDDGLTCSPFSSVCYYIHFLLRMVPDPFVTCIFS
jgi:hypothetical protein